MRLQPSAMDDILSLQDAVFSQLRRDGAEHFLVPLDAEQRNTYFENGHYVFGIYVGYQLAAQCIFFDLGRENLVEKRLVNADIHTSAMPASGDFYIINEMVHPAYRGRKFMSHLLVSARQWLADETLNPRSQVWATVLADNAPGLSINMAAGMRSVAYGFMRGIDKRMFLLAAPLDIEQEMPWHEETVTLSQAEFLHTPQFYNRLAAEGFRGTAFDSYSHTLTMARPSIVAKEAAA